MKLLLTLAIMATFTFISFDSEARGRKRIKNTQERQMKRIRHGVRNGSLTRREARQLGKGQVRVAKARKRAAKDGKMTKKEAARIRAMQAKQSGKIFKEKHDGQNQN